MHMLLSEDITHFNVNGCKEHNNSDKNKRCPDLLLSLLISRCPVSRGVGSRLWEGVNKEWELVENGGAGVDKKAGDGTSRSWGWIERVVATCRSDSERYDTVENNSGMVGKFGDG